MSAAVSIPYRLAPTMCHAIGCLASVERAPMCERHWKMLSVRTQDALAQMAPHSLRHAMDVIAKKEGRGT